MLALCRSTRHPASRAEPESFVRIILTPEFFFRCVTEGCNSETSDRNDEAGGNELAPHPMTPMVESFAAARLDGGSRVKIVQVPLADPGPGEVRIKVKQCGV